MAFRTADEVQQGLDISVDALKVKIQGKETPAMALARNLAGKPDLSLWKHIELTAEPDTYHPQMAFPASQGGTKTTRLHAPPDDGETIKHLLPIYRSQFDWMVGVLDAVFRQSSRPPRRMLACTEFETLCRGILRANGYSFGAKGGTTVDYWKLMKPLRLDEYGAKLTRSLAFGRLNPFEGWDSAAPTKSLGWYSAYNAVKHDREANFKEAKLLHAVNALLACRILMVASFGEHHLHHPVFVMTELPTWNISTWRWLGSKPREIPHSF